MKLTKATIKLICELEQIIGDECYNPSSFDGWTLEEGCAFRYPVTFTNKEGLEQKERRIITDMNKDRIDTIRYKFGANNLFIGKGICKILERLEKEYNIDFDELTKNKK